MSESLQKFQESWVLIRQGLDLMVEAASPLLQQQAKIEVTMASFETFMGDTKRRLTALEEKEKKRDARLTTLETNLSKALVSLFPRVESILSKLERKEDKENEQACNKEVLNEKSPVMSTSKQIPKCSQTSIEEDMRKKVDETKANKMSSKPVISSASPSSPSVPNVESIILDRDLISATNSGNLRKMRNLIAAGANVNTRSLLGKSAVCIAALNGHLECVQELIISGADISATDSEGYNAIHLAASRGKEVVLEYLLSKDIDVNVKSNAGETALLLASKNGHKKCLLLLLEHFAEIDPKDNSDNRTPLHHAVINNNVEIAVLLLEWGADLYNLDSEGKSPLFYAFQSQNRAMHDAILSITDDGND